MRPLRDQRIEDLRLRGRAQSTIDSYVRCVRKFVQQAGVQPARLTEQHVRGFLLHLMDARRLSGASLDVYVGALKCFLRVTMNRPDIAVDIPRRKVPMRLPSVPSQQEVAALLDGASIPEHRAMFETLYGAGLRVSELRKLRSSGIDSRSMVIHVHHAKRGRERHALLSPQLLETLRSQFRDYRPAGPHLFPGRKPGACMTPAAVAQGMNKAARNAGLRTHVHPHSRRHA